MNSTLRISSNIIVLIVIQIFCFHSNGFAGGKQAAIQKCELTTIPYSDSSILSSLQEVNSRLETTSNFSKPKRCKNPQDINLNARISHISQKDLLESPKYQIEFNVAHFLKKKLGTKSSCINEGFYQSLVKSVRAVRGHSDFDYSTEEVSALLYVALKNKNDWEMVSKQRNERVEVPVNVSKQSDLKEKPKFYIDPDGHLSVSYRSKFRGKGDLKSVTKRLVLTDDGTGLLYLNPRAIAIAHEEGDLRNDIAAAERLGYTKRIPSKQSPNKSYPGLMEKRDFTRNGKTRTELEMFMGSSDLTPSQRALSTPQLVAVFSLSAKDLRNYHRQGEVLRDVKPGNILIRGYSDKRPGIKKVVRNIDLGMALKTKDIVAARRRGNYSDRDDGTFEFKAPELFQRIPTEKQSPDLDEEKMKKRDVYAFGLTLCGVLLANTNETLLKKRGLFGVLNSGLTLLELNEDCNSDESCILKKANQSYLQRKSDLDKIKEKERRNPEYVLAKIILAATHPDPTKRPTMQQVSEWLRLLNNLEFSYLRKKITEETKTNGLANLGKGIR